MPKNVRGLLLGTLMTAAALAPATALAQGAPAAPAAPPPLESLITATPEEGFALAVRISRRGIGAVQSDVAVRRRLRPDYAENADSLIAVSHVISLNFATVAAANNYWRR